MKILLPLLLLLSLTFVTFSQQGKLKIGSYTIYDSSGVLVISGGMLKVNANGWINPKDLNSTVAGNGLSLNTTLGLRFNAGTGLEIGSNDSVVSTQELSFAQVDSIAINGVLLKSDGNVFTSVHSDSIVTPQINTDFIGLPSTGSSVSYEGKMFLDSSPSLVIQSFTGTGLKLVSGSNIVTVSSSTLNFTAGASVSIGTTDNFNVALKRNNSAYMTLGASDLTIEGNTPLKFANGSIFTTPDGLTMASLLGIPNGIVGAVHTGWILMKNTAGATIYVPYWKAP